MFRCIVFLPMTIGMEQHQVAQLVILVVTIAVMKVPLPDRIEGVGFAFDLEIALRFDHLLHPDHLLAGERVGEAPSLSRLVGKVALSVPASSLVRMAALGPAIQPPPDKAVEPGEGLATDHMAMIICPAAQDRVEGIDERFRGGTHGLLTASPNLGLESLKARLAGGDAQLGWLTIASLVFAQCLP